MSLRFWRWFPRRSDSSIASNTADSSAIAGVSPSAFVAILDRKTSRYSLLETIAACSVVAGVVLEDWDEFLRFIDYPTWGTARVAIGGFVVAVGIALEIWFSSRSSSAERKIRDWYALRVAELNLKAEQENAARVKLEKEVSWRRLTPDQKRLVQERLRGRSAQHVYLVPGIPGPEARGFTQSLNAALAGANWITITDVQRPKHTSETPGVCVMVAGDGRAREAGKELAELLEEMGFSPQLRDDLAIGVHPSWWPQELANAFAAQQKVDVVLVVVLDRPEPKVFRTNA